MIRLLHIVIKMKNKKKSFSRFKKRFASAAISCSSVVNAILLGIRLRKEKYAHVVDTQDTQNSKNEVR